MAMLLSMIGRNIKNDLRIAVKTVGATALVMVFFIVYGQLSGNPGFFSIAWTLFSYLVPFVILFQFPGIYFGIALSMGTTRRAAFIGLQILKVIIAFSCSLMVALGIVCNNLLSGIPAAFSAEGLFTMFGYGLLAASVGDFMGFFSHRVGGKLGMVFLVAVCAICGGVFGGTIGMMGTDGMLPVLQMFTMPLWVCLLAVVVSCVLSGLAYWLFVRRYAVR